MKLLEACDKTQLQASTQIHSGYLSLIVTDSITSLLNTFREVYKNRWTDMCEELSPTRLCVPLASTSRATFGGVLVAVTGRGWVSCFGRGKRFAICKVALINRRIRILRLESLT